MNHEQQEILNELAISDLLEEEIKRLTDNGVSHDEYGYYPLSLSLLIKVALENIAESYGVTDRKIYELMRRI